MARAGGDLRQSLRAAGGGNRSPVGEIGWHLASLTLWLFRVLFGHWPVSPFPIHFFQDST